MKRTIYSARHIVLLAPVMGLALAAPAFAAGVPAGTEIDNTATATYEIGGGTQTTPSNTVTIKVDELLDVAVASQDGGTVALDADGAVLTFEVTNVGNGPEAYEITFDAARTDDDFDPAVTSIAYDSDGSGDYTPGVDVVIPVGGATPEIPADGTLLVFVITELADNPDDGDLGNVELTATAVTGSGVPGTVFPGEGVDGSDAVVGTTTATDSDIGTVVAQISAVTLSKSFTILDPFGGTQSVPGAIVTYTLVSSVSGSSTVSDLTITDAIPAGTTYQPETVALDSVKLTDVSGDDAGTASNAAGVTVDLGNVAGGTSNTITFDVIINQ